MINNLPSEFNSISFSEFEKQIFDFFDSKVESNEKKERRITGGTGKGGAIMIHLAFAKECGATEEILKTLKEKLEKELKDGYYEFGEFGIRYKG